MPRAMIVLFLLGALQAPAVAQDADLGKRQWQTGPGGAGPSQPSGILWCQNCHGANAEGGFGPDLAGRGLSVAQVARAVRQPWGIMPRYPEASVPDATLANLTAYFASLPKVATPGAWKAPAPAAEPRGPYVMTVSGCYQCHGAQMANPRRVLGGEFGATFDFALFADVVYHHDQHYPQNQMGLFSRDRLTEPTLRDIYAYLFEDLGLRVPITARAVANASGRERTLTVMVSNDGVPGKGLTAEGLTIEIAVPPGTQVQAGGAGYDGVRRASSGAAPDTVVWNVRQLAPGEKLSFAVTTAEQIPASVMKASTVRWAKPSLGVAAPSLADSVAVQLPPQAARPAP